MKDIKKASNNNKTARRSGKKQRRWGLLCMSFILAFMFWLYVAGANDVAIEQTYDLVEIQYDSAGIRQNGLVVQSISIDTVNVTVMGSQRDLLGSDDSGISAKISLDGITKPGEYTRPVVITTPDRTTVTHQTVDQVTVTVDRPSEKTFSIDSGMVELVGWTLDSGCFFGTHTVSESSVTVKGPTLELDKIKSVKIRTGNIGTASDGKTVTAHVVLLDANGNEINSKNITLSGNADLLTIKLSVYMQKTVKLTARGKYGYFGSDNISVSPSEIVIKGTPDAVKAISSLSIYEVDETKTVTDQTSIAVNDFALPAGITTATGETTVNAEVSVLIEGKVIDREITISPDNIHVYSAGKGMKALESVGVRVRLSASADPSLASELTADCIIASVDATKITEPARLSLSLRIAEDFRDLVYLIDIDYTVEIGIPEVKDDTPSIGGAVTPLEA